jgi:von Willebrand factor type A domain
MKRSLLSSCVVSLTIACGSEDPGVSAEWSVAPAPAIGDAGGQTGGNALLPVDAGALPALPITPPPPAIITDPTPPAVCSSDTVQTTRVTPDMLIVFDRSLSMQTGNRWTPSVSGLKSITSALSNDVAFGLMMFPGGTSNTAQLDCFSQPNSFDCLTLQGLGGTGATCTTGSVNVPIARGNASAIAAALDATRPDGATPTAQTLQAARSALGKQVASPDEVLPPKFVILVTDGEPNCTNNSIGNGGTDQAAIAASVAAIQAMASDGIKTYVLGYGTQSNATTKSALDQMARAGATGDTAHRPIENQASLISAFQQITGGAVSCDYVLEKPVSDKRYVRVTVDGKQLAADDANGWVLSSDKRKVHLQGSACSGLSVSAHLLNVTVECEPVPAPQ